jgi:hypothetical protein
MKKWLCVLWLVGIIIPGQIQAQDEGFGLGVLLGEPTGINFKAWTSYKTAVIGTAAWSFGQQNSFQANIDYIIHDFDLIRLEDTYLPVYYGIGVRVKTTTDVRMGIRIPLGINYMFETAPLDLFVEFVPVFDLAPKTELYLNGGIGIRYFF